jgi:hypothetical protein
MNSRFLIIAGTFMLALGSAAVMDSALVLSTFVLEIVTQTIGPPDAQVLEPFEFSWGTMHWGHMERDYSTVVAGFFLIAIGQLLILPGTLSRIAGNGRSLPTFSMMAAALLTIMAGGSLLLASIAIIQALGVIATSGAADPVSLGESMPVLAIRIFTGCLAAAQALIIVAAVTSGHPSPAPPKSRILFSLASVVFLFGFAALIAFNRIGPIRELSNYEAMLKAADPQMIATQISLALKTLWLASPLLLASGITLLIPTLLPVRKNSLRKPDTDEC